MNIQTLSISYTNLPDLSDSTLIDAVKTRQILINRKTVLLLDHTQKHNECKHYSLSLSLTPTYRNPA